jgi:hypothetical protein
MPLACLKNDGMGLVLLFILFMQSLCFYLRYRFLFALRLGTVLYHHFHIVKRNVLNFVGPFRYNLRVLFINAGNPFSENIPFAVGDQVVRYDVFNTSKPEPECPRRVKHFHNVMRIRIRDSNVNALVIVVLNYAQMNRTCVRPYYFQHVIVHDFFIHIEFIVHDVRDSIVRDVSIVRDSIIRDSIVRDSIVRDSIVRHIKRGSAQRTRGIGGCFVPFQQARHAKQVPAHGVRVSVISKPGSTNPALSG